MNQLRSKFYVSLMHTYTLKGLVTGRDNAHLHTEVAYHGAPNVMMWCALWILRTGIKSQLQSV